ncbi:MAG: 6-pyruvoyl-tetrahydropterin synthase-related protein [Candidatus Altiarchaeota archaeon]
MEKRKEARKKENEEISYLHEFVNFFIMIAIWIFLLSYYKPSLMFANKTTTGGDMVGYYYMTHYASTYLIPNGKIIGWAPGWFAGFPMFQFYFPLVFVISALLSYIIPLYVSFKIVTMLGVFTLPLFTFFSLRLMKFSFPIPIFGAIITLPYLFLEHYSMWGGNIPSTLAGEFSYGFSISLMVLFFGLLWRSIKEGKSVITPAVVFALIVLSHGITTVFSITSSLFFLISVKSKNEFFKNLKKLAILYILAFMLSGFYFFPMVFKSEYSTPHKWLLIEKIPEVIDKMLFPKSMYLFYALGLFGIYIGITRGDDRINFFTFSLLIAYIYFFSSSILATLEIPFLSNLFSHFMVVKFLPYIYLLFFILSVVGFYPITKIAKAKFLLPLIVFLAVWIYVSSNVTYIHSWIQWNYSGFEAKQSWKSFQRMNEFLSTAGPGRVEFEYEDSQHNSGIGSSRAMEALPVFSKPTLIGTQFQGGVNNPIIYSMECEYTLPGKCPCPLYLLTNGCLLYNLENAKKHLALFNVKYLIATTSEFKKTLRDDKEFKMVYGPDTYEVYELMNHQGNYVVLPKYEPVLIKTKNWRKLSYEWFKNIDTIAVPVVFSRDITEEDRKNFKYIIENFNGNFSQIPKIEIKENCSIQEKIENEKVTIKTSCINKPLWIKISYFPNWQVSGAKKIYMASPVFMLIFPEKEEVVLYYGRTLIDWFGTLCSYIGVLILVFYINPLKILRREFSLLN